MGEMNQLRKRIATTVNLSILNRKLIKMQYFYVGLFFSICFLFNGCSTKEERISDLVDQKKFAEAESVVNELSLKEKQSPEIQAIIEKLKFRSIQNKLPELNNSLGFSKADSVLSEVSGSIRANSPFSDSLNELKKTNAFNGAKQLANSGKINDAYSLILGHTDEKLNKVESALSNTLRMKWLTGRWSGINYRNKRRASVNIEALTPKLFSGYLYEERLGAIPLENGNFDGKSISASYQFVIYKNPLYPSVRYTGNLIGFYDHGNLKVELPGWAEGTYLLIKQK